MRRSISGDHDHVSFALVVLLAAVGLLALLTVLLNLSDTAEIVGPPVGSGATEEGPGGVLTFRGDASRTFVGEGPVPEDPAIQWTYPGDGGALCSFSSEGLDPSDTKEWCGTGWTGQPNVVPQVGGFQVRVGAFDGAYHFIDAGTGVEVLPPMPTGDLAKGSATTDPDFPLYYAGSRDNLFRVVALDRPTPEVLWTIDATTSVPEPMWNDDWDGAALVVEGHLLLGGENGWFYVVRLNRSYGTDGKVQVDPEIVQAVEGWDDELLEAIGDDDVSIEGSVAFRDGIAYFGNSGGLVQGWDVSDILDGRSELQRVFRFWTGDDTDATVVIDPEGSLYVASEYQRFDARAREVGQLMKLDPRRPDDPLIWSLPALEEGFQGAGGSWSTPAIDGDRAYFTTAAGRVLAVDLSTGAVAWELQIGSPSIASPVVVDGVLIQGDCTGHLYAWDVRGEEPELAWDLDLGDCIESTPAVWRGWIYVGTREGSIFGIADDGTPPPPLEAA
jgi:outer membrane protein assembly factor BamB